MQDQMQAAFITQVGPLLHLPDAPTPLFPVLTHAQESGIRAATSQSTEGRRQIDIAPKPSCLEG